MHDLRLIGIRRGAGTTQSSTVECAYTGSDRGNLDLFFERPYPSKRSKFNWHIKIRGTDTSLSLTQANLKT